MISRRLAWTAPFVAALTLLAADTDRVRLWREDLAVARTFTDRDRSFTASARAEFRASLTRLDASLDRMSDNEIVVSLARAAALSGNAHTRLYLLRNRSALRRYPLRVWWFREGLYVVRARPEHAALLGMRIVRIAGRDPRELRAVVGPLFAGNASWIDYMSTYSLTSPDVLEGLGIVAAPGTALFTLEDGGARRSESRIEPLPLAPSDQPTEAWWSLSPQHPDRDGPWSSPLPLEPERLPLYLRKPQQHYWREYLPSERLYYLQYNRSADMKDGESVAAFGRRVLAELSERDVEKLVVDLRFNTGGNLELSRDFLRALSASEIARSEDRLFVIIGRTTFSAGISAAAQLRQDTKAILVGEPVGDALDMWSEGGNLVLPNSKLTLHYADGFHSYSKVERPEFKPYNFDLSVDSLDPDLPVAMSAADYFAGRDAVLERILRVRSP